MERRSPGGPRTSRPDRANGTEFYQVDRTNGIVTVTTQDITSNAGLNAIAANLVSGTPVKVYGVPRPTAASRPMWCSTSPAPSELYDHPATPPPLLPGRRFCSCATHVSRQRLVAPQRWRYRSFSGRLRAGSKIGQPGDGPFLARAHLWKQVSAPSSICPPNGGKTMNRKANILVLAFALFAALTGLQALAQVESSSTAVDPETKAKVQQHLQHLSSELNLTDDQKQKIQPILQSEFQQLKTVHNDSSLSTDQKQAKMTGIRDSANSQIAPILTPDQQKKLAAMKEQSKDDWK
jgi:Spy/CpxP family protein refolding chaperone